MTLKSSRNFCLLLGAAVTFSACSYSGSDRYGSYDSYADYGGGEASGYYGSQAGMAGCDMGAGNMDANMGSGRYGAAYNTGSAGAGRYGGGYSDGSGVSLRKSRYGSEGYYEEYSGYGSSRYGGGQAAGGMAGCGYWVIPTYQVAETPPPPTVTTPTPPPVTVVPETVCESGQYKMADGTCAIMMTEEPEIPQYIPPVSYPEPPRITPEYYQPIRK